MIVITVARKPLEGTVAQNVLKWGTGGLNIDGSRIGDQVFKPTTYKAKAGSKAGKIYGQFAGGAYAGYVGRWPTNLVVSHAPDCINHRCIAECPGVVFGGRGTLFFKSLSAKKATEIRPGIEKMDLPVFDMLSDPPAYIREQRKITLEFVPSSSWGDNLRSRLAKAVWDDLRKEQYRRSGWKCEICGGTGIKQGFTWPLECHEIWAYDDATHIQKLVSLIALCPLCHQATHLGSAIQKGNFPAAFQHLITVNGWSAVEAEKEVGAAFSRQAIRSQHNWVLDLQGLLQYGIDPKELPDV